jgi:hypothetical protein
MARGNTDVTNPNKLFVRPHPEVAEIGCKTKQDKLNGYAIVVRVNNGRIRITIGFPTTSLKINA